VKDRRAFVSEAGESEAQWPLDAPMVEVAAGHFVRPWENVAG